MPAFPSPPIGFQFNHSFTFRDAARIHSVPACPRHYRLLRPHYKAVPGVCNGYDLIDPGLLESGWAAKRDFAPFTAARKPMTWDC